MKLKRSLILAKLYHHYEYTYYKYLRDPSIKLKARGFRDALRIISEVQKPKYKGLSAIINPVFDDGILIGGTIVRWGNVVGEYKLKNNG